jgi:hypothetical protein
MPIHVERDSQHHVDRFITLFCQEFRQFAYFGNTVGDEGTYLSEWTINKGGQKLSDVRKLFRSRGTPNTS